MKEKARKKVQNQLEILEKNPEDKKKEKISVNNEPAASESSNI